MFHFIAAFLAEHFPQQAALVVARCDVGTRAKGGTWRERLNRAVFASPSRVTFESPAIAAKRELSARRIRCEVFADNSGITGKAIF
jgi:hypothetical protein